MCQFCLIEYKDLVSLKLYLKILFDRLVFDRLIMLGYDELMKSIESTQWIYCLLLLLTLFYNFIILYSSLSK